MLEVEKTDVVDRRKRVERRVFDRDRLAVAEGELLRVIELHQIVPDPLPLDRVLLEAQRSERLRIHPGREVVADEKELREEFTRDRGKLELVDRAALERGFPGRQSQLARRSSQDRHREAKRLAQKNGTSIELRLRARGRSEADGEREEERRQNETIRF